VGKHADRARPALASNLNAEKLLIEAASIAAPSAHFLIVKKVSDKIIPKLSMSPYVYTRPIELRRC